MNRRLTSRTIEEICARKSPWRQFRNTTFRQADTPKTIGFSRLRRVFLQGGLPDFTAHRRNWEDADLAEIIAVAASAYVVGQDARLTTSGPQVRLTPQVALGLAMALQELATNALNHGAGSNGEGVVAITWTLTEAPPQYLDLTWHERGGPQVAAPTRKGFGMRLLERNVGADINGVCKLEFQPEGLVCRIQATVG